MQAGEREIEEGGLDGEAEVVESPIKRESVKDTVRRAYDQIEKETAASVDSDEDIKAPTTQDARGDNTERPEKVERAKRREVVVPEKGAKGKKQLVQFEATKPEKNKAAVESPVVDEVESYPPDRFTLEEKEAFNKAPAPLKKALKRLVQNHEAKFTETQREYAAAEREARGITDAVYPFAKDWADKGFTVSQGVVALARAHEKLIKEPIASLRALCQDLGVTPQQLIDGGTQNGQVPDISQHPLINQLTERVNRYENERQQQTLQQKQQQETVFQSQVNGIVQEVGAVREQKDATGRYLYPKLHDSEFLKRVTPLVIAIAQTAPDLPMSEVAKRAYHTLEQQNGDLSHGSQARPNAKPQNIVNKPRVSTISSRGRGGAGFENEPVDREAYRGLSIKDTMRLAYETLEREG